MPGPSGRLGSSRHAAWAISASMEGLAVMLGAAAPPLAAGPVWAGAAEPPGPWRRGLYGRTPDPRARLEREIVSLPSPSYIERDQTLRPHPLDLARMLSPCIK